MLHSEHLSILFHYFVSVVRVFEILLRLGLGAASISASATSMVILSVLYVLLDTVQVQCAQDGQVMLERGFLIETDQPNTVDQSRESIIRLNPNSF